MNTEENGRYNEEALYSKSVRAGKRTYFFDVRSTRGGDYYLTITESKKRFTEDGKFSYEKHKVFLYKEDFEKFTENFGDAIDFIKKNAPVVETATTENTGSDVSFEDLGK
ncbi:MAG TPA: DUF3276 family protein [Bacteroidia bacterium]|jgi:hypothetical protein|nr:DUF3276 family protein [Bacteroidia bacterium]